MSEESQGIDPYDIVLADLYAKLDQINQAIAAIESVRGGRTPTLSYAPHAHALSALGVGFQDVV